jgi:hypothetical protein
VTLMGVKRKKFKNDTLGFWDQFQKVSIFYLTIASYFILNYSFAQDKVIDMQNSLLEYNFTTIAEPYFQFIFNS